MRRSRLFKAEIIVLLCVAILWAVNLKTHCVPRATAGALRQVVKVAPDSQLAHELLGFTYYGFGHKDEGDMAYGQAEVLACQEAVESCPTDPNAHYELGDAYFYQERYEDAVTAYRQTIQLDPNAFMAYLNLGIALDRLGRHEEKMEAYKEIVRIDPQDAGAHFNLGDAYYQQGDLDAAISAFEEALSLDSSYGDAYEQLAGCYWELDQPEKSIETWKRAVAYDPEWAWPRVRLAFDYNDVGRYDDAIKEWKEVILLKPDVSGFHILLGDAYVNANRRDDAISAYRQAVYLGPENKQAHFRLGKTYLETGDTDSASEEYEVVKGLDEELADDLLELIRNHEDTPEPPEQAPPAQDDSVDQDEARQLQALDAELSNLDSYAAQEQAKIETWYLGQVAGLKARLDKRLEALNDADKVAWVQFQQRANETWSMTTGDQNISVYDGGYGFAHGYGSSSETTHTYVKGNPAGEYAAFLAQINNSKQATQQDFLNAQRKLVLLQKQKLDTLEAEIARKTATIALRRRRITQESARRQEGDRTPRVEAIGIAPDGRPYVMIGGRFIYEGEAVNGYRVQDIQLEKIEFEKDGEIWVQKVQ